MIISEIHTTAKMGVTGYINNKSSIIQPTVDFGYNSFCTLIPCKLVSNTSGIGTVCAENSVIFKDETMNHIMERNINQPYISKVIITLLIVLFTSFFVAVDISAQSELEFDVEISLPTGKKTADGEIKITLNGQAPYSYSLLDTPQLAKGKIIKQEEGISTNSFTIAELKGDNYLLMIIDSNNQVAAKKISLESNK